MRSTRVAVLAHGPSPRSWPPQRSPVPRCPSMSGCTITNGKCVLGYKSVSHRNTRIVFHIINNGSVSHGFDISAKFKSGLVKAHQESTLVARFGRPGAYRYACVAAHSTVKKGVFTIRKR